MTLRAAVVVVLALLWAVGCEEKKPPSRFRVTFESTRDGAPLEGVAFTAAGRLLGTTGPKGLLRVDLRGYDGDSVQVRARCPEGHREPPAIPPLVLRPFRGLDPAARARGLVVSVDCAPAERVAAVVVRVPGQGDLPIRVGGRVVTQTDPAGVAHVLVRQAPGATFRVDVDTSARPDIQQRNPGRTFTLADRDEVVLYDQPVEQIVKKAPRRRRPRPAPAPTLPTPILPSKRR